MYGTNQALNSDPYQQIFQTLDPDPHEMDADPKTRYSYRGSTLWILQNSVALLDPLDPSIFGRVWIRYHVASLIRICSGQFRIWIQCDRGEIGKDYAF